MKVTECQESILRGRVTWPDLVCFQKISLAARVEDEFVNEEAAAGSWLRNNETFMKR